MKTISIFLVIYLAMIAHAFWEAYVEGRNPGYHRKLGWKIKIFDNFYLLGYHFFLFWVMWPALLSLPLVIYGWNLTLFGILLSAYTSGLVLEDILWFVVNPETSLKDLNPEFCDYYPWIKIGKFQIPVIYPFYLGIALLSWFLFWR